MGAMIVVSPEELEALIHKAVAQALDASKGLMPTKQLTTWLGISMRTWRRMLERDAELRGLGFRVPRQAGGAGRVPRYRWSAIQVKEYLRRQAAPPRAGRT